MKTLLLILSAIALSGCSVKTVSTERTSNVEINIELLFEKDGIKVYRFSDGYRNIYYTDARGTTSWDETHSDGKTTTTTHHRVETVQ